MSIVDIKLCSTSHATPPSTILILKRKQLKSFKGAPFPLSSNIKYSSMSIMQSTHIWIYPRHRGSPQKLKTDLHNSSKCHVAEVLNHFLSFKIFSTSHTGPFSVCFLLKMLLFTHSYFKNVNCNNKPCNKKPGFFSIAWLISVMPG